MKFTPLRIALIYLTFALIWIMTTDFIAEWLFKDPRLLSQVQTIKGIFYISMTALGLYLMQRSYEKYISREKVKLEEIDRSLNIALNSAKMATWEFILDKNKMITSENFNSLLGIGKQHEVQFDSIYKVVHPDDQIEVMDALSDIFYGGGDFAIEYRIVREGEERWIWLTGEVKKDKDLVQKVSGVAVDITAQKKLEHELNLEQEKFEKLFDKIPVLIDIYDPEKNFSQINQELERVLGWTMADIEEKNLLELCYPDPGYRKKVIQNMDSENSGWIEYQVMAKNGEVRDQLWTNIRLSDDTMVGIGYDITERKKLEEQLDAERRELLAIYNNMPVFINTHDAEGNIDQVNDFFKERLGFTDQNLTDQNILKLIIKDEEYDMVQTFMQKSDNTWRDFELITRTGETLQSTWTNVRLPSGKSLGIGLDISERAKIEQELKRSKERLQLTTASANVGLWEWHPQTGETNFDEIWANLVGYKLEELQPVSIETWNQLVHPDDLELFEETVNRYFEGEIPYYECEVRMKHKKGHWVWILDRGKTVEWDEDGNSVSMMGTHIDITDRKKAEEIRKYNSMLLENVMEAVIALDQNNTIRTWNERAMELYGWDEKEAIGKDLSELVDTQYINTTEKDAYEQLNNDGVWKGEVLQTGKNGKEIWILSSVKIIRDQSGEPQGLLALNRDITELKENQTQLIKLSESLSKALEAAKMATWDIDLQTNDMVTSSNHDQLLGLESRDLNNSDDYLNMIYEEDKSNLEKAFNRALNENEKFQVEFRVKGDDGLTRWFSSTGQLKFFPDSQKPDSISGVVRDITELKEIESRLEIEQERFEIAANISSDVIWEWNPVEEQLWWGEGIETAFGFKPSDYLGDPLFWQNHISEADRERVVKSMDQAEQGDSDFWSEEYSFISADGSQKQVHDSAILLRNRSGKVVRIIGAMLDVTEINEYQKQLKHQSYRFEMIAKTSNDVLYEWNVQSDKVWWSEGWQTRFGIPADEVKNTLEWWEKRIHDDDRKRVIESLERAAHSNNPSWKEQYRLLNGRNEYSIVLDRGYFIKNERGENEYMMGTVSDITDEVRAEEQLKASEQQYKLLFEENPIPMWIYEPDTLCFSTTNRAAQQKYGYSKQEFLDMTILDIRPENDHNAVKQDVKINRNRKSASFSEWVHVTQSGKKLIVEISASTIPYQGKPHRLIIANDITSQRQAEERAISAIIEGEERERQRIAKELHDGLGQYLSAANMNLQTVYEDLDGLDGNLKKSYQTGLDLLRQSIQETRNISQNLLPKAIQDYGLELAIESLINQLRNTNRDIRFHLYRNLEKVEIPDKIQINLYRIAQEALNNAIRHGKPKEIHVQLVFSDGEIFLSVEDNGVGFDTEQVSSQGIGLRSMKTRVGAMAANIDIVSTIDRGTIVSVVVPLNF